MIKHLDEKTINKIRLISTKINELVFFVFIICIPLTFLDMGDTKSYTFNLPFFVSFIGILFSFVHVLFFANKELKIKCASFLLMPLFLSIQSIIATVIFKTSIPQVYTQNVFFTNIKESIYILHAFLLILYNYVEFKIFKKQKILVPFLVGFGIFLFFGYLQIGYVLGIKFFGSIINFFNILKVSRNSYYFEIYKKICASTPEAAHMTQIIVCYFIPTSVFLVFEEKRKKVKIAIYIFLALLIPIIVFSHSTELIATIIFTCVIVLLYAFAKMFKNKKYWACLFIFIGATSAILVFSLTNYFRLYFYEKLFGNFAYSAQKRFSHIYNAFIVFLNNPGFGIGSGIHGYFYRDNIIDTWFMGSIEVRNYVNGTNVVPTAAPFLPYFLSSYGLFGLVFLTNIIVRYVKNRLLTIEKKYLNIISIGLISFVFLSTFVENIIGSYYLGFLLSLSYLSPKKATSRNIYVYEINI